MRRDVRVYLADVLDAARLIGQFTVDRDLESYRSDAMLRSAVERQLEIIGEALIRLVRTDPTVAARISDVATIIGFRNVLAHGYDVVDDEIVWETIRVDLPRLEAETAGLLAELEL